MSLILLVEDNVANQKLARYILERAGHEVIIASNGRQGLEMVESCKPALVVMDIQLPGLDGLSATRAIRARSSVKSLPVLAVTACAMPGDRERILAAGCDDYMAKPIRYKDLIRRVEALLHKDANHDAR